VDNGLDFIRSQDIRQDKRAGCMVGAKTENHNAKGANFAGIKILFASFAPFALSLCLLNVGQLSSS
jgi:hypothetical protein